MRPQVRPGGVGIGAVRVQTYGSLDSVTKGDSIRLGLCRFPDSVRGPGVTRFPNGFVRSLRAVQPCLLGVFRDSFAPRKDNREDAKPCAPRCGREELTILWS
jgi:hypothetical protein